MSDAPQGQGWWIASDGRWYPPELHPGRLRPPKRTLAGDVGRAWYWFRSRRAAVQVVIVVAVIVLVAATAKALTGGGDGSSKASSRATTTLSTLPPTTTTTLPIPPGEDKTIANVIDGDSFAVDDGTRIRLIGVNAPEIETTECFSAEATARQKELLPVGTRVRLVYDEQKLDRFGRTLAYVYRLPDGIFVNLALARDGFAREQNVAPNTKHADEFRAAVEEARTTRKGLWSACPTTTTAAPATTRPAAAATTTTAAATTTTAAATSTTVAGTTSSVAGGATSSSTTAPGTSN